MAEFDAIRVLIVEDDEDDFVLTRDLLAGQDRAQFEVEWAPGPIEAHRLISQDRFDVYLVDHRLGASTGLDLVRQAFADDSHPPVVMLTGHADYEVDLEATKLGVTDFLVKDRLDPALLERSIRYAIRHHEVLDELRESQERYALAVSGANDGIWDWDLVTGEVYFGPRWKQILGHSEEEIGSSPDEWLTRVHPENVARLRTALDAHLDGHTSHFEHEHRIMHADGSYRWVLSRALAVRDRSGNATRIAGSMSDITDRKNAEERLLHDARHDSLTGLLNRTMFLDHLDLSLRRAERDPGYRCAVLFLDLNRFKLVNDGFSHAVGDKLLRTLAQRLNRSIRPGDTVARFGGDEFTILLHDIGSSDAAIEVAERIQEALREPFRFDGRDLRVTGSIGIALSAPGSAAAELMRNADIAMYEAKHERAADLAVFNRSMRNRLEGRLQIESSLREAIEAGRLRVFYQPIVEIESGTIQGFEALARWPAGSSTQVSPIEFIPVAEDTGLIRPLGRLVLHEACGRLSDWQSGGLAAQGVTMSVNVSGRQLGEPDLVEDVLAALDASGLPASSLRLEVTESSIMRDPERMPAALDELEAIGVGAHIDDFGTGYSSLTLLRHFPGNALKIDRSFVTSLGDDEGGAEIVRTIIALARNLELDVIAEGIETAAQLRKLHELGGRGAQGFLFSEPLPPDRIEPMLESWDASSIAVLAHS